MRIGLISDIHGNAVALEAVLADIQYQGVDQVICLGDVVTQGPQPVDVLRRLQELDCPCVMGNHDAELLAPHAVARPPGWLREMTTWCREQLSITDWNFLRSFQPLIRIQLEGQKTLLCCHGSPRSRDEFLWAHTPQADLEAILADYPANVLACGHTHTPMLRLYRGTLVVTTGSVGYPIEVPWPTDNTPIRLQPWAEYALLEATEETLEVRLRRIPVNFAAMRRAVFSSGMPDPDFWVAMYPKGV